MRVYDLIEISGAKRPGNNGVFWIEEIKESYIKVRAETGITYRDVGLENEVGKSGNFITIRKTNIDSDKNVEDYTSSYSGGDPARTIQRGTYVRHSIGGEPTDGGGYLQNPIQAGTDGARDKKSVTKWHNYNGDIYWVENQIGDDNAVKSLKVKVLNPASSNAVVSSALLKHFSRGMLFKDNHFVCWDDSNAQITTLTNSSLGTTDTVNLAGDTGSSTILEASPTTTSYIHSLEKVGGYITWTQSLLGYTSHPSAYTCLLYTSDAADE